MFCTFMPGSRLPWTQRQKGAGLIPCATLGVSIIRPGVPTFTKAVQLLGIA